MDLNKLFEEFWYEYQGSLEFEKLWKDTVNDSQRYGFIATDFVEWLMKNWHIKEVDKMADKQSNSKGGNLT